jgi:rubrerythrin
MEPRTRRNVEAALAGEAMAALRYLLFADQAREEGYPRVAGLFESAGRQERREHFRELAGLIGLVGTTESNLRTAISGEMTEHRSLYPRYAAEARRAEDLEVAARFQELGADEHRHADVLRGALEELEIGDLEVVGG